MEFTETDAAWLRRSFDAARRAGRRGDGPFGAVLVDEHGRLLLEDDNTTVTSGDVTGHAEINVVRRLAQIGFGLDLSRSTLFASTEPCAMCAASIHFSGIGRVVFGLSSERFREAMARRNLPTLPGLALHSRDVFARSERAIEVVGPVLEDEALELHEEFWH